MLINLFSKIKCHKWKIKKFPQSQELEIVTIRNCLIPSEYFLKRVKFFYNFETFFN